jgi:hypothetical protein
MEYGGGMNELPYPSDLTAAQWALIEPLLPAPKPKGRKRKVDLRKITNAILYVLKGGISWRMSCRAVSGRACCSPPLPPLPREPSARLSLPAAPRSEVAIHNNGPVRLEDVSLW